MQINDADLLDAHFHVSLNVLKIAIVGFPAGKIGGFTDRDVVYPIIGRKERCCCGRSLICLDVPADDQFCNLLIGVVLLGIPALLHPVIPPSGRLELHQDFFIRLFREIQFQTVAFLIDNELCVHGKPPLYGKKMGMSVMQPATETPCFENEKVQPDVILLTYASI